MPTEPHNTYLFRWGQSFVPRCPIDDGVHRLKKIYFFPPVQFVRNGSPCEWKTTFSTFFFLFFCSSYQLNELFFIRRQRYAISPTTMPFFVASLTSILSLERTFSPFSFFLFFIFASFFSPLFFDSSSPSFSRPPRIIRGWSAASFCLYFLRSRTVLPFVVSSPSPLNRS